MEASADEGGWNDARVNEERAWASGTDVKRVGYEPRRCMQLSVMIGDARRKMEGERRAYKRAGACRAIRVQNGLRALRTSTFAKSRVLTGTYIKSGMEGVLLVT